MLLTSEDIKNLFFYRKDVFAIQLPIGSYIPIKRPVEIADIDKHLEGTETLGAYCLDVDNKVKWACVDLDGEDLISLLVEANKIYDIFPDFDRMLEFSGRRGYHVWLFFKEPVFAEYAKTLVKARLKDINLDRFEVFPKQTELNEGRKYGNLVKVPLGLHRKSGRKSEIIKTNLPIK
jgi:hypothetical protein